MECVNKWHIHSPMSGIRLSLGGGGLLIPHFIMPYFIRFEVKNKKKNISYIDWRIMKTYWCSRFDWKVIVTEQMVLMDEGRQCEILFLCMPRVQNTVAGRPQTGSERLTRKRATARASQKRARACVCVEGRMNSYIQSPFYGYGYRYKRGYRG